MIKVSFKKRNSTAIPQDRCQENCEIMKKAVVALMVLVVAVVFVVFLRTPSQSMQDAHLLCHVGGTMTPTIEEIAKLYEAQTGVKVDINAAGSGELLAYISGQKKGDIYICHDPFVDILMNKYKYGIDAWQISELTPVIIVQKGNPKNIRGIRDLTRDDVNVILTDYELSTLGYLLPVIFKNAGIDFDEYNQNKKIITNKSGGYAANYVAMSNADAGIVWNAVWKLRSNALDAVSIEEQLPQPGIDATTSATGKRYFLRPVRVTAATLTCSKNPEMAKKFIEFMLTAQAIQIFKKNGFTDGAIHKLYEQGKPVKRDLPADCGAQKSLVILAAAGMRRALDELVADFKDKTGITVDPDYGGSGVILARAVATDQADMFMPADKWYIEKLKEKTDKVMLEKTVAEFVPVIIVQKGNPMSVKGLSDLTRSDLRVGLGEAMTCEVGVLTEKIFKKNGIDRSKIAAKESTTVNELGVWVKMKNIDAAIVWDAIARNLKDDVDIITIPDEQAITSLVTISLLKTSGHAEQAKQFIDFVTSSDGRKILADSGYNVLGL